MKKLFFLAAMLLMSATAIKADVYSDGLKSFLNSGASSQLDVNKLSAQLQQMGVDTTTYSAQQMLDDVVEILAPYYRQNFTEEQMQQFVQFYAQPQIVELTKKSAAATEMLQVQNQAILSDAIMKITTGQTPADIQPVQCSPAYLAAFDRYWEMADVETTLDKMTGALEGLFAGMQKGSEEEKKAGVEMAGRLISYLKTNFRALTLNSLSGVLSEQDLVTFTSVMDQPFYPAMRKTNQSLVDDLPNFLSKIIQMATKLGNGK